MAFVEKRLANPNVVLNSFIMSWTEYAQLDWGAPQAELEDKHVLFMTTIESNTWTRCLIGLAI